MKTSVGDVRPANEGFLTMRKRGGILKRFAGEEDIPGGGL